MFIVMIRTTILYFLVILVMRLMGKRQIGELQPYEFAITIMISALAALPMQDSRLPLALGIIPIITLLFIKTLLTQLQLKSQFARRVLEGEPTVLICRGKIVFSALKKQQINLDELMEELRLAGFFDLEEIQYGILENNGQMSFLTYDWRTTESNFKEYSVNNCENLNSLPKTAEDEENNTNDHLPKFPIIYILDGEINKNTLTTSGKSKEWIDNHIKHYGVESISDILLLMTDTEGRFVCQLYNEGDENFKS